MRPFQLYVGPVCYCAQEEADLKSSEGARIDGEILHGAEKIAVHEGLPEMSQRVTVVHELIHAILQQAGHFEWYKEEGLLDAMAYGLVGAKVSRVDELGNTPLLGNLFDAMDGGDG
jgi:hypothetical protein